jgi:hypothetical protein
VHAGSTVNEAEFIKTVERRLGSYGRTNAAPGYVNVRNILRDSFKCVRRESDNLVVPNEAGIVINQ